MNGGWQRPGGPPEITFEIPLVDDRPRQPRPEPAGTARRLPAAIGVAVLLGLVGAVVIAVSDDGGQTAAPATTDTAAVPPTLAPVDDERIEAPATPTPTPTFPAAAVGVPSIVLAEFDLQSLIEHQPLGVDVRGVSTITSPSLGEIEFELVRDGAGLHQLTVHDRDGVQVAIYDETTGDTYRRDPGDATWVRDRAQGAPTPALLDSLLYGPLRGDTIARAVDIDSGPVVVIDMAGRATGPPMRVFRVTMPAGSLADSMLEGFGMIDPSADSDLAFSVHASERLGVELVATSVRVDGEQITFRHRTEALPGPPTISLPRDAEVVDEQGT